MQSTYLFRVYKEFKLLFVLITVWAIGTLWFALKSHEEFPFLLFGMYSLKEEAQGEYTAYSIVVDKQEVIYKNMQDAQRELVLSSLSHQSPSLDAGFMNWLKNYSAQGKPMEIYKLTCFYAETGQPVIKKHELIYPHDEL